MREMRVLVLIVFCLLVPIQIGSAEIKPLLRVSFLDIGQGDAIYIQAPNGRQMLIDGGPASNLSTILTEVLPFADHSLDVLMVTNPDADHYAGFIPVVADYSIGAVIEPGTITKSASHKELQSRIHAQAIPELLARKGMTITLDTENKVTFTVLFPDRDVSTWSTNDGSIIGVLSYGTTQIMFTGDATKKTESFVIAHNPVSVLASDILKVGHHGSRTSTGDSFVQAVHPQYAVISDGRQNKYKHPHKETLATLARHDIEILRTDMLGTITFVSDGTQFMKAL